MNMSVEMRAKQASGRERYCAKCQFRTGRLCPHLEVCHAAFVRGYIRGDKDKTKILNTVKTKNA